MKTRNTARLNRPTLHLALAGLSAVACGCASEPLETSHARALVPGVRATAGLPVDENGNPPQEWGGDWAFDDGGSEWAAYVRVRPLAVDPGAPVWRLRESSDSSFSQLLSHRGRDGASYLNLTAPLLQQGALVEAAQPSEFDSPSADESDDYAPVSLTVWVDGFENAPVRLDATAFLIEHELIEWDGSISLDASLEPMPGAGTLYHEGSQIVQIDDFLIDRDDPDAAASLDLSIDTVDPASGRWRHEGSAAVENPPRLTVPLTLELIEVAPSDRQCDVAGHLVCS